MHRNWLGVIAVAFGFALANTAQGAIIFEINFSFSNFEIAVNSDPVPQDPVSGKLFFEADSIASEVTSVVGVDLEVDGKGYSVPEVAFDNGRYRGGQNESIIGGALFGADGMPFVGTDDFWIIWDRDSLQGLEFSYQNSTSSSRWVSSTVGAFSITQVTAIPEPSSLLYLIGPVCVWTLKRRYRRRTGIAVK